MSRTAPPGWRRRSRCSAVRLLDSPVRANQARNTNYLMFLDPDRMLHTFRRNYGLPSAARPVGGWEAPQSLVRGHCTGHLLSGLALTYASTGHPGAAEKGRYLVAELGRCQSRARAAGFHDGYLSAFPESFFDRLEAGLPVWSPYYMIHKIMAGLIDQHELAGNGQALELAARLGDWVSWRTSRLSYAHMQRILEDRAWRPGRVAGQPVPAHLGRGVPGHGRALLPRPGLRPAGRRAGRTARAAREHQHPEDDRLPADLGGDRRERYHAIAANFWRIVTRHHSYVIGGTSNYEHWHAPDDIAGQLTNRTCENCCSYNMLKLTRLLHFHQPHRTDLLDHYERTLFNQMLASRTRDSAHGFNIYYTGLSPARSSSSR